ncbi:MAG: methyltransferase domain-containing protein [Candidatus Binatia bacterium]
MASDQPSGGRRYPAARRRAYWLLGLAVCAGALGTGLWISAVQFPPLRAALLSPTAAICLAICAALTLVNVLTRWFRWHFLIRRYTPQLVARDSLAVYLATLPAIISPFFIAELVRVVLIRKRFAVPAAYLVSIWLIERVLDASVLGCALLAAHDPRWGLVAALALLAGAVAAFRLVLPVAATTSAAAVALVALVTTSIAWMLPVAALSAALWLFAAPVSVDVAVRAFAGGTLFGGLTGLPLGVLVTGSTMIHELTTAGVAQQTSVLAVLVYRAGTAWFAVLLGLAALVAFRRRLVRLVRGEHGVHFDEIAGDYEGEIPAHMRERLLDSKVDHMARALAAHGIAPGARGLDLGCGQGWYAAAMRERGYAVAGTDYSRRQLHAARRAADAGFVQADAQALPFRDASCDFVYSVNAMHHMTAPGQQARTLREVVRVLRPGGIFLLHEINTSNPLFRWYMGYVFPLLRQIDEGNEQWILPSALPEVEGARWASAEMRYFTFLPDFLPGPLLRWLGAVERYLERSRLARYSAHYQACLRKPAAPPAA